MTTAAVFPPVLRMSGGRPRRDPVVAGPRPAVLEVSKQAMGWSERHAFFERIVALRERYARAASGDERTGVLSVADAMLYAEAVMIAVELDDEPWLDEPAGAVAGVGEPAPIDGTPRRPGETGDRARRRRLGDRGRD